MTLSDPLSNSDDVPDSNRSDSSAGQNISWRIVPATRSDHVAVYQFLSAAFQGPPWDDFRISLEDPTYDPRYRLLGLHGPKIVGHVQLTPRVMQFGSTGIPVVNLSWLGVLPDLRGQGYGHRLLAAAEEAIARQGAFLGLLWSSTPDCFECEGWVSCGPRRFSQAGTRELLATMAARGLYPRAGKRLNIRPWRRLELESVARLFHRNLAGRYGPFHRSEAYWQWLMERHGYGQFYVAVDGRDRCGEDFDVAVVGYAAVHGGRIVELMSDPDHVSAEVDLLARACGDAIESDRHSMQLHIAPDHRLHRLFHAAHDGTARLQADGADVLLVKLLNPIGFLRLLKSELAARAKTAGLNAPAELSLHVDGRSLHLELRGDEVCIASRAPGPNSLTLSAGDFCRLALGHFNWETALASDQLKATTPEAVALARAFFPNFVLWRPLLDDLPTQGD